MLARLAAEGCNVVITGRDRKALKTACAELADIAAKANAGGEVRGLYCEVRQPKSVAAVFADVKKRWGKLDILANNAGISQAKYSVEKTPIELWRAVIDINLTGTFLCSQAAIPLMPPGSTIVNTLSIAAKQNFPEFSAYNASKHGALGFTRTLREELIPKGIRVMALLPGATDTAIWEQFWPDAPRDKMVTTGERGRGGGVCGAAASAGEPVADGVGAVAGRAVGVDLATLFAKARKGWGTRPCATTDQKAP